MTTVAIPSPRLVEAYNLKTAAHRSLLEALRRVDRFFIHGDASNRYKTITEVWSGLGARSYYKAAIDAGLMECATELNPRHSTWWKLTPQGARIVLGWYLAGYRARHMEGVIWPEGTGGPLLPPLKWKGGRMPQVRGLKKADHVPLFRQETIDGQIMALAFTADCYLVVDFKLDDGQRFVEDLAVMETTAGIAPNGDRYVLRRIV